jgi:hypothetical protein
MQLASAIQAQTLFLSNRSWHGRKRSHLVTRATLNPLADVAVSLGSVDNVALLALPAIAGAALT